MRATTGSAPGRAGGSRDEFMAIFYDTRRLVPEEYDHFALRHAGRDRLQHLGRRLPSGW